MKALILKDLFMLLKQMKIFLLLIVFFAFIPGFSGSSFAIIYSAMMPISALAYDEQSKWNSLAATMPYSPKSMVFSKYVLGYIFIGCTGAFTLTVQTAIDYFKNKSVNADNVYTLILIICVALVLQAVNLPIIFKIGVEKGRLAFFVITIGVVMAFIFLATRFELAMSINSINTAAIISIAAGATLAISIISIFISEKIFISKQN